MSSTNRELLASSIESQRDRMHDNTMALERAIETLDELPWVDELPSLPAGVSGYVAGRTLFLYGMDAQRAEAYVSLLRNAGWSGLLFTLTGTFSKGEHEVVIHVAH